MDKLDIYRLYFFQMAYRKFIGVEEAVQMIENDDFVDETDVVILPSKGGDGNVTDEEEGDDDHTATDYNEVPRDVSGHLELFFY